MKVSILGSTKSFNKFCTKQNKIFGCKDAFMCNVSCPAWIIFYMQLLMNEKGYTQGEAHRQTIRESIEKGDGRKIIKDAMTKGTKEYPKKDWRKKYETEENE